MKIPRGQGLWPAFWLLGDNINDVGWPNSGEIDVMENIGREPGTVHGTLHGPGYSGAGGVGTTFTLPGGQAFADAFHTFAIDWAPDSVRWSVDGIVYQTRTPADVAGRQWAFNHSDCNGTSSQQWTRPGDGTVRALGKCLDATGNSAANGTPLQIWDCTGGTNQKWNAPAG